MSEKLPLLDRVFFSRLIDQIGKDVIPTLMEAFHEDTTRHIKNITSTNLENLSHEKRLHALKIISFEAHALCGSSSTIGLSQLSKIGQELEITSNYLCQNPEDEITYQKFTQRFKSVQETLSPLLEKCMHAIEQYRKQI